MSAYACQSSSLAYPERAGQAEVDEIPRNMPTWVSTMRFHFEENLLT